MFSNLNSNCSNLLDMRNLQGQVKKELYYLKLFWPLTVWINCSSDQEKLLKFEAEGWEFAKKNSHSRSEQFWWILIVPIY